MKLNPDWRFRPPSSIPYKIKHDCEAIIGRCVIGTGRERKERLEHFKTYFARAAGIIGSESSSLDFAEYDLHSYMSQAASNAPLFIEAFYEAFQTLPEDFRPSLAMFNGVFQATDFVIDPPNLIFRNAPTPVAVPEDAASTLDRRAQELIQKSLSESDRLLAEGMNGNSAANRRAVQEVLWLLETIVTAFKGLDTEAGTVSGKYFNRIIADLRGQSGKRIDQVLGWMVELHGYLSSPTGGGVRHGIDIKGSTVELDPKEARLFCNLIRSYIVFLLDEHARLNR